MAEAVKELSALDQSLVDAITKATQKVGTATDKTVDFVMTQAPDLAQQLLLWKLSWSIILTLVFLAITVLIAWFTRKEAKTSREPEAVYCGGFFFGALSTICVLCNLKTVLLITLAPKIYLIEYMARLLK